MNAKRVGEKRNHIRAATAAAKRRDGNLNSSMLGIGSIFKQKLEVAGEVGVKRFEDLMVRLDNEEAKNSCSTA